MENAQQESLWTRLRTGSQEATWSAQEAARRGATALYKCPEITAIMLGCQLITWASRIAALAAVIVVIGRAFVDLSSILEPLVTIERALAPRAVRLGLPLIIAAAWLVGLLARAIADAVSWGGFSHAATRKTRPDAQTLWLAVERHLPDALVWGLARDLWFTALAALAALGYVSLLWMQVQLADGTAAARALGGLIVATMYASGMVWGGLTAATMQLAPTIKIQRELGWAAALEQALGLVADQLVSLYRLAGYAALAVFPFAALVWVCGLLQLGAADKPELLPAFALLSAAAQFLLVGAALIALTGLRAASFFWVAALDGHWPAPPRSARKTPLARLLGAFGLGDTISAGEADASPAPGHEALLPEQIPNVLSIQAILKVEEAPITADAEDAAPAETPEEAAAETPQEAAQPAETRGEQ